MVKWFFADTPFEFQIFTNDTSTWYLPTKEYYEIGVYKWSVGLGKYTICWDLPKLGKDYIQTPSGDYVWRCDDEWKEAKIRWDFELRRKEVKKMKIIERFKDANMAWRLNYDFFNLPLGVCIEAYIRMLIKGVK